MSAVSRPIGFVNALARLLPIVPSNANPANVAMNVAGRIKTMQPMLPQNTDNYIKMPQTIPAI